MRRRTLVLTGALTVAALVACAAPPVAQYLSPPCQDATSQAEAAHAATRAARRRNARDVPALYADEAAMRGFRASRCGPLARLFDIAVD